MKKIFFLFFFFIPLFVSCEDAGYESVIPDAAVHLVINLTEADYVPLQGTGAYKTFTKKRTTSDYIGYGGLLVCNTWAPIVASQLFSAYDLACPYCYLKQDTISRVVPDAAGQRATCPKCGSIYDIMQGTGVALSGTVVDSALVGRKDRHLRIYSASYYSNTVTVSQK
jgi:hypothetical protein